MSDQRIIYPEANNAVSVIIPFPAYLEDHTIEDVAKKDVPIGKPYRIVDKSELPTHMVFRRAWEYQPLQTNHEKAKEIAHEIRRQRREIEFAPLDDLISKKIPNIDYEKVEADRQKIRDKYAEIQASIDSCDDTDELEGIAKQLLGMS